MGGKRCAIRASFQKSHAVEIAVQSLDLLLAPRAIAPSDAASDHEETMRIVAAELRHQAMLPIEIGLHRAGGGVGALVRTPVALRRIRFWQNHRRPNLQRAVIAAVEHESLPAHLR